MTKREIILEGLQLCKEKRLLLIEEKKKRLPNKNDDEEQLLILLNKNKEKYARFAGIFLFFRGILKFF